MLNINLIKLLFTAVFLPEMVDSDETIQIWNAFANVVCFVFFQPVGFMEQSVPYSNIEDVHVVSRWDIGNKFCIRITVQDGSILIQVRDTVQKLKQHACYIQIKSDDAVLAPSLQFAFSSQVMAVSTYIFLLTLSLLLIQHW